MDRDTVGSAPRNGKTFDSRIHKIDSAGKGVIETAGKNDIILGPVDQDAVGERIEAMKLPGPYARIKRPRKILPSNYIEELQDLVPYDFSIDYGDAYGTIGKQGLDYHEKGYGILEYVPPWETNELHEATIDRRSNAGNGIVYIDDRSVNIGPVREGVTGSDITVILVGPSVGVCKTISVRAENYFKNLPKSIDEDLIDTTDNFKIGMKVRDREADDSKNFVVVNLPPIPAQDYIVYHGSQTEISVAEDNPQYDQFASVVIVVDEKTLTEEYPDFTGDKPIPLETLSSGNTDHYTFPPERLEPTGDYLSQAIEDSEQIDPGTVSQVDSSHPSHFDSNESGGEVDNSEPEDVIANDDSPNKYRTHLNSGSEINSSDLNASTATDQTNPEATNSRYSPSTDEEESSRSQDQQRNTSSPESGSKDLDELREKAQESAVEEVSQGAVTTNSTSQYSRSSEIREYVMARADGTCEGCNNPAPFTSKTGEPYLHAHHIHELSDGGSDTPDTVTALCPNCHYRVHHGKNGDEFNKELLEKVQRLEEDRN
ncbi:HNH endonuclease [Halorubrum salinarum]|uniref:HNH endonuclease n=1 Tax=Halorubrum salinarum TaxID=2739057 RepID=A0A7D3XXI2_9EURY|nr:HNH endonuclease [Halorubrum salinarum]QKG91614.1 HNH endonuclease [Halorubrum salinarum]